MSHHYACPTIKMSHMLDMTGYLNNAMPELVYPIELTRCQTCLTWYLNNGMPELVYPIELTRCQTCLTWYLNNGMPELVYSYWADGCQTCLIWHLNNAMPELVYSYWADKMSDMFDMVPKQWHARASLLLLSWPNNQDGIRIYMYVNTKC